MQVGEVIIIITLTIHTGLTGDQEMLLYQSLCSQDAAPKALANRISHKCHCLDLMIIVRNKSYDVLKKDGYIRRQDRLFHKYVQCIVEIIWKTCCKKSVTIKVVNVLEYTELKLYAFEIMLSLNFMAYFYVVKGNKKTFQYMDFYCTKNVSAPNSNRRS